MFHGREDKKKKIEKMEDKKKIEKMEEHFRDPKKEKKRIKQTTPPLH